MNLLETLPRDTIDAILAKSVPAKKFKAISEYDTHRTQKRDSMQLRIAEAERIERQERLLEVLRIHPRIGAAELQRRMGTSKQKLTCDLYDLMRAEKVEAKEINKHPKRGQPRSVYWLTGK